MNAPAPPTGSFIAGKYRVERVLGSGGMAVVVEATHVVLGQRVAIKVLRSDAARSPSVIERFRQEAQIAAQLPGDHIVRVTDVGQTESGEPFLVMELLKGRDLEAELLGRGCLPMEEAVDLMLQACEGIAEAHAVGLVHRDLKPGNLFVTRRRDGSPLIKVLDFGISKLLTREDNLSLTQATDNFGTPLYMSPEQIQSAKNVDARSDQHAIAAILYTLLAGQAPWNAPSLPALSVLIATQPPPSLRPVRPDVPSRLEQILERALAKNPANRFADLAAFAYALVPFGSAGAQASVRRITSALASAAPQGVQDAQVSEHTFRLSPVAIPPSATSSPGLNAELSGQHPSFPGAATRTASNPAMHAILPPGVAPPFAGPRGMGQTSSALTTPLGGDRGASARRKPLAIAFVTLTALSVALVVALVLFLMKPNPVEDAGAQAASESSAAPSPVEPATAAAPVVPPEPPAPVASASASSPAPEPTASASAQVAGAVVSPPLYPAPKPFAAAAPKPGATTPKTSVPPKKRDPGDVFGAKR